MKKAAKQSNNKWKYSTDLNIQNINVSNGCILVKKAIIWLNGLLITEYFSIVKKKDYITKEAEFLR